VKKISFQLLELEMADLERFLKKTPLGPLGVKNNQQQFEQFDQRSKLTLMANNELQLFNP
jgi:hypothetical protein